MPYIWVYFLAFTIIFALFSFVGLRTKKREEYTQFCYDVLSDNDFDPPEIHIMSANKRSCVKRKNNIAYIYLVDQGDDVANKKMLTALLAFTTSDYSKSDGQYYTNLDVLMNHVENKEDFLRTRVPLKG